MLRQFIGDLEPVGFGLGEDVAGWPDAWIIVKRTKGQRKTLRIIVGNELQRRATGTTERSRHVRRGMKHPDVVLTGEIREIGVIDPGVSAECGAVRLSTHRAMTMARTAQGAADLIANISAKTAASNHRLLQVRPLTTNEPHDIVFTDSSAVLDDRVSSV